MRRRVVRIMLCSRERKWHWHTLGVTRSNWSHPALQAAFTTELIHRRKALPATLRDYLSAGLAIRQAADYSHAGISLKVAHRAVRRAEEFLRAIEELVSRETTT
jgi:uncharacterized protein (UPF0332 family)